MEVFNMAVDGIHASGAHHASSVAATPRMDYSHSVGKASESKEVGSIDKAGHSKSAEKSSEIDTKDKTQISKEAKEGEDVDEKNPVNMKELMGEEEVEEEKEKTPEEKLDDLKTKDEELQKEEEAKQKELEKETKELEELKKREEELVKQLEQAMKDGDEEKVQELQGELQDINSQIQDKMKNIKDLKEELGEIKQNRAENNKQQQEIQQQIQAAQQAAQQQAQQQAQQAGGDGGQQAQQAAPVQQAGGNNGGGGNNGAAPAGGCNGGGGGAAPASGANGANGAEGTNATNGTGSVDIKLTADDQKVADFINNYLEEKQSPAAGQGAGEMMVKYGKEYDVDPLVLLSIAGQETQYGKAGIGVNGMLGVGAYDSDPNNATRNPQFSGIENQIRRGAETFSRLREKGGSSSDASIADQTAAVNKAGWATDPNWHKGVTSIYNQIANKALDAGIAEREGGGAAAAELAKQFEGQTTYNIQGLDHLDKSIGYDLNCANFVSACLQNTGGIEGHYNNCSGLEAALQKQGYVQVSADQAQPGDVWFNPQRGHTELVKAAGNPPVLIGSNNGGDNIQEVTTDSWSGRSGVFYHKT